jgi:antirestriction protein ArdC
MNGINPDQQPVMEAEQIIFGFRDAPEIIFNSSENAPCYYPAIDQIHLPPISAFSSAEAFYRVLYHESIHNAASVIMPHGTS